MSTKLEEATAGLIAKTTAVVGKVNSLTTFIEGIPALVGAAVTDALAAADVAADAAAGIITSSVATIEGEIDEALAAANINPAPEDPPVEETPADPPVE